MRYGFFNSEITGYDTNNMPVYDRAEEATFFAKYFSQFISTGVYANPSTSMQVVADTDMTVKVLAGACFINGYMGWVENPETLTIEEAVSYSRIDRIVARLSIADRKISLEILQGEESGNPTAPELTQDSDIYEIALAEITITQNTIEITDEEITDLRLDTELCGVVTGAVEQVDTTTLFKQYQSWLENTTQEAETNLAETEEQFKTEYENFLETINTTFTEWYNSAKQQASDQLTEEETNYNELIESLETSFTTWFNEIKGQLDEDAATSFQRQLTELKEKALTVDNIENDLTADETVTDKVLAAHQGFVLNELISTLKETVDTNSTNIENSKTKYKELTLVVDSWTLNKESGYYEYDIINEDVTESHLVEGFVDLENQAKLTDGYIDSYSGGFKIITSELPTEDITMYVTIQKVTVEEEESE